HPHSPRFPTRRSSDLPIRAGFEILFATPERMSKPLGPIASVRARMKKSFDFAATPALIFATMCSGRTTFLSSVCPHCLGTCWSRSEEHTSELQSPYDL